MILERLSQRAAHTPTNLKLILIVTTLAGGILVLTASLVALRQLQRRRKLCQPFQQAYLHEPGLTWDEYGRRGRLTRSRLMLEEESHRSTMIRKCRQSRASEKDAATAEEPPPSTARPPRSRSRTWHGQSKDAEGIAAPPRAGGQDSPRVAGADGGSSAEAGVDGTWQLLHRSRSPPALPGGRGMLWSENGDGPSAQQQPHPPTVRLKTPPLLSHPLFRDGHSHCRPKHMSLPTELTRAKIEPVCTSPTNGDGTNGHSPDTTGTQASEAAEAGGASEASGKGSQ